MSAFIDHMRVERGLSEVIIGTRRQQMRRFFDALPTRARSVGAVTIRHVDAFLASEARRGWSRGSLHALGSSVRSFFRYAAHQGWCRPDLVLAIDLPRLYAIEDVPRAPTSHDVDGLLDSTAAGDDPVAIRDHAILSLLAHYGLRRGEVERLTLDDLDWTAETVRMAVRDRLALDQCAAAKPDVGTKTEASNGKDRASESKAALDSGTLKVTASEQQGAVDARSRPARCS